MTDLLQIAADWSAWERPFAPSIPRRLDLPDQLSDSLALVIQGVRRCGKSTLMQQLPDHYRLDPARCLFINFEDPRLLNRLNFNTLQELVDGFHDANGHAAPLHFFFDEVQWVEGWQRWLRMRLDRPNGDTYVVSGSNARLLSGELGSALTGRHLTVELYPFDFREMRQLKPERSFDDWLYQGGFPEPAKMPDGDRLLRQYLNDIVERDVRERIGAQSSLAIRQMVQMVFETAGSELSLRRVAAAQGIAVETAAKWLEACQHAYLLFGCPYFAWSERKRAARNVKYYPIDTGFRRVVATPTAPDQGKALECASFLELRRRFGQVFYWRDGGAVDFVVTRGREAIPIQVSLSGKQARHERALDSFYEAHPHSAEAIFISRDNFYASIESLAGCCCIHLIRAAKGPGSACFSRLVCLSCSALTWRSFMAFRGSYKHRIGSLSMPHPKASLLR